MSEKIRNQNLRIEEAKNYFHGAEGYNCVQAVLKAFQKEYDVSEKMLREGKAFGGGRARNGVCGALYAIEMIDKDMYDKIKDDFEKEAASLKCTEIKALEKLSCRNCVGYIVERVLEEKSK